MLNRALKFLQISKLVLNTTLLKISSSLSIKTLLMTTKTTRIRRLFQKTNVINTKMFSKKMTTIRQLLQKTNVNKTKILSKKTTICQLSRKTKTNANNTKIFSTMMLNFNDIEEMTNLMNM